MRDNIGILPDTIVFGWDSAVQLSQVEQIQKLVSPSPTVAVNITPMQAVNKIKDFFGFKYAVVGVSMYATTPTSSLSDIWTDNCVVAYVGKDTLGRETTQNFGC